jgi:hypothetical protein
VRDEGRASKVRKSNHIAGPLGRAHLYFIPSASGCYESLKNPLERICDVFFVADFLSQASAQANACALSKSRTIMILSTFVVRSSTGTATSL